MFERCCENRSTEPYSLTHNPKPISVSADMDRIVKEILWYVPNISSYQSPKNDLVEDKLYDDFSFTYILNQMGMNEDTDVLYLSNNDCVSDEDWEFYEEKICTNCQKMIITAYSSQSKTNNMLRCLRNCVAHGQFTIVGDYLVGFNRQSLPNGPKKAVIKIKPELLLNALKSLMSPLAKEKLISYALERVGYTVTDGMSYRGRPGENWRFDLIAEKDNRKYVIEIKDYRGTRYLHKKDLVKFVDLSDQLLPDTERVLFIDTSYVTKDVREWTAETDNFKIVDIRDIRQLLADEPVDILE